MGDVQQQQQEEQASNTQAAGHSLTTAGCPVGCTPRYAQLLQASASYATLLRLLTAQLHRQRIGKPQYDFRVTVVQS